MTNPLSLSHVLRFVASFLALGWIATAGAAPVRQAVPLPTAEFLHERAIMRDHLEAMARIEHDLSAGHWQEAAQVAQMHLGLSVMGTQGMQAMRRYMPPAMQHLGMQFHNASANLVVQIQNGGATGDLAPALHALSQVTSLLTSDDVNIHSGAFQSNVDGNAVMEFTVEVTNLTQLYGVLDKIRNIDSVTEAVRVS